MENLALFLLTVIASTEGFIVASGGIALYLFTRSGKRRALHFLASAALFVLAVAGLKELFAVGRPDGGLIEVTGYAFPSGHAAGSAFLALSLAHLVRSTTRALRYSVYAALGLLAGIISASRIGYGVHTPLQVFAGLLVGALIAFLFAWLDSRFTKPRTPS